MEELRQEPEQIPASCSEHSTAQSAIRDAQEQMQAALFRKQELEARLQGLSQTIAGLRAQHAAAALLREEEEGRQQTCLETPAAPHEPESVANDHKEESAGKPDEPKDSDASPEKQDPDCSGEQREAFDPSFLTEVVDKPSVPQRRRRSHIFSKRAQAYLIQRRQQIQEQLEKDFKTRRAKAERMKQYSVLIKNHFAPPVKTDSRMPLPKLTQPRQVSYAKVPANKEPYVQRKHEQVKRSLDRIQFFNPMWDDVTSRKRLREQPQAVIEYANTIQKIAHKREVIAKSMSPPTARSLSVEADAANLLVGSIRTKLKLLCQK